MYDPDGPGPLPQCVLAGGASENLGDGGPSFSGLMAYDLGSHTWFRVGPSLPSPYTRASILPSFGVVAHAGTDLFRLTGSSWTIIGSQVPTFDVMCEHNGELVLGGSFNSIGGTSVSNVARLSGGAWMRFGNADHPGPCYCLSSFNGTLVAGGPQGLKFITSNSLGAYWLDSYLVGSVSALAVSGNALYVGGTFSQIPTYTPGATTVTMQAAANIAKVAGGMDANFLFSWIPLAGGVDNSVGAMSAIPGGGVVVAGSFYHAGLLTTGHIAKWDGTAWSGTRTSPPFPSADTSARIVVAAADSWYFKGGFDAQQSSLAGFVGWSGGVLSPLGGGGGANSNLKSITARSGDEVVAGGRFYCVPNTFAPALASWDDNAWSAIGDPFAQIGTIGPSVVDSVIRLANGDIVATGLLDATWTGQPEGIARWDGQGWHAMGSGLTLQGQPSGAATFELLDNGDLVAGGAFSHAGGSASPCVARWDGSGWSSVGAGFPWQGNYVVKLLNTGSGLFAGGALSSFGTYQASGVNGIARWNGSQWVGVGGGVASQTLSWPFPLMSGFVTDIAEAADGSIIVVGNFTIAGGQPALNVARWNGVSWASLGGGVPGNVLAVAVLPSQDVVVAGSFTTAGGSPAQNIARFDGQAWSEFEGGLPGVHVVDMELDKKGRLVIAGNAGPYSLDGQGFIRRFSTTCPALAGSLSVPCVGPFGACHLVAEKLPWVRSFLATRATFPTFAAWISVTGLSVAFPGFNLMGVFPNAWPGCEVNVAPDILVGGVDSAEARVSLFVAPTPSLLGVNFYQQAVLMDLASLSGALDVWTTDVVQLTAGVF